MADRRTLNIVILGLGFLFIFTAFTTCGNVEHTVVKSLENSTFSGSGFHSLGIIYGVFSFSNLLAPMVVAVIGPKICMFISGLLYSGYVAVFIAPSTWALYFTSVLIGVAAALLWTAQGQFLVANSEASTINRNTGMFWALLQCSMLFGNLYVYFEWNGRTEIPDDSRRNVFLSLMVVSVVGTLSFLALSASRHEEDVLSEDEGQSLLSTPMMYKNRADSAIQDTKSDFRTIRQLLKDKTIVLLSPSMAYSGLELSFYSGVYGTCVGATAQFGAAAKGLIGISGIVVGVGEIVGEFRLWVQIIGGGGGGGGHLSSPTGCSARRGTLRAAVQEQSLQTDLCGVPGDGRPFRGLLPDLPQHARRRAGGLQHRHPEGAIFDSQRVHRSAVQLPAGTGRQLLQHAALQHPGPRLRRGQHARLCHL
uniref:UNC93-like protein MFSD11 n=1 Tax=Takifugu rubripes TaxID=31033 RepID=A0A674MMA9_TAKRU